MPAQIQNIADRRLWKVRPVRNPSIKLNCDESTAPVVILGAGAAYGCVPLANELKSLIISHVQALARRSEDYAALDREWNLDALTPDLLSTREYLTLEVLCTMLKYRFPTFSVTEFWEHVSNEGRGKTTVLTRIFSGTSSRSLERRADTALSISPTKTVDFGALVHAQDLYRAEDQKGETFRKAISQFKACGRVFQDALLRNSFQMRFEEEAILLVGTAIARDYLGLIELKKGHRDSALCLFEECRQFAAAALGVIVQDADNEDEVLRIRHIAQPDIWMQIAIDNRARCLPGRSAVRAFIEAIESRTRMIEDELKVIATPGVLAESGSYLIARHPQRWLRASELIKVLFDCAGVDAMPKPIDEVNREIAEFAIQACRDSFERYQGLCSRVNQRFPAYYEAQGIFLFNQVVSGASSDRDAAVQRWTHNFKQFQLMSKANPEVSPKWASNALKRFRHMEHSLRNIPGVVLGDLTTDQQ